MLLQHIIKHLLDNLALQGFNPVVHFELEGVFELSPWQKQLDYSGINSKLKQLDIDGELKTEYWKNQWEYVSLFNGQSPLKEAQNLDKVMQLLPQLMRQYGAANVLMQPVAWGADSGRYLSGSGAIFSIDTRSVHIPNAIQLNVSVENDKGENLFAQQGLGEWVQYHLLKNSYHNCILFLPEEDAFKRLSLRKDYGLDAELSSPVVLSGGHQGSIALYKEKGKHNQAMGQEPLFFAADNSVLSYTTDWQKTARVEHRIGATSQAYNPYLNVIFALLNVLEGISSWKTGQLAPNVLDKALPRSINDTDYDDTLVLGALSLFENDNWLVNKVDLYCQNMFDADATNLGKRIRDMVLAPYQGSNIALGS
ncbi:hypothetical protein [Paraglaciecola marina]|uniref:hypothetical protein n=1 Tax=Paraglaciecola marina TaxID=2500157 RepID=UPI00105F5763|nr:hypothetical protein [Paraglaciecola marina]